MTTAGIVDAYVAAVHERDPDTIVLLFAPDARLTHPAGTFTGPDEIAGFYREVVFAGQARLEVGAVLVGDHIVMAELAATSDLAPDAGTARAIDVFHLDEEGRIELLDIYYQ